MTRRDLLRFMAAAGVGSACASETGSRDDGPGRLRARPRAGRGGSLGIVPINQGFLYVPRERTLPLIVLLHGAGGNAQRLVDRYRDLADEFDVMMFVPQSRGATWDVVRGEFGPDIEMLYHALERIFATYSVDARHIVVGGFSDGASYALSVGITNGDLFTHIVAFSPGFAVPASVHGSPRIFISHGTEDEILPIASTSRRIVPRLRAHGYRVEYVEFDGPHTVPREIARRAFAWFKT